MYLKTLAGPPCLYESLESNTILIGTVATALGESDGKSCTPAALAVGAFAVSYLGFRYGPGVFKDSRTADPPGMVWVPGGTFWMGSDNPKMRDARPNHQVAVDGFWIDQTAVTNQQFARFVEATGYVTVAESRSGRERHSRSASENLVAGAVVFTPPDGPGAARQPFAMVELREGRQLEKSGRPGK